MKKSNLVLVCEGYDPSYSNFNLGEMLIVISRVYKLFYDDNDKFVIWEMFSNGRNGTSRRWRPFESIKDLSNVEQVFNEDLYKKALQLKKWVKNNPRRYKLLIKLLIIIAQTKKEKANVDNKYFPKKCKQQNGVFKYVV